MAWPCFGHELLDPAKGLEGFEAHLCAAQLVVDHKVEKAAVPACVIGRARMCGWIRVMRGDVLVV